MNTAHWGDSNLSRMIGKIHRNICALVAGLMVHAMLLASLPLVWCAGSGGVHAAELVVSFSQGPAIASNGDGANSLFMKATSSGVDRSNPVPETGCFSHHKLIGPAACASQTQPDPGSNAAIAPRPYLESERFEAIGCCKFAPKSAIVFAQLQHLRTVVLLI